MREITGFAPDHASRIFEENARAMPLTVDEMIRVYTSPGSVALTLMVDGIPAACGGIINLAWHRGEAWLLTSPWIDAKSAFRYAKRMMPLLAERGQFRRVQATSFDPAADGFFRHLGFQKDGLFPAFGPGGENAIIYSRLFPAEAAQ